MKWKEKNRLHPLRSNRRFKSIHFPDCWLTNSPSSYHLTVNVSIYVNNHKLCRAKDSIIGQSGLIDIFLNVEAKSRLVDCDAI